MKKIDQALNKIEKEIVGPFVLGEQFSLADIFIYPWFERWCTHEKLFNITIPKDLTNIHAFIEVMR